MKNVLKRVALCTALMIAVVCMGLFVAACNGDANAYSISVVYEDGTAVNGKTAGLNGEQIEFQLCYADGSGCLRHVELVDENGKANFDVQYVSDTTKTYHVQLNNITTEYGGDEFGTLDTKVNMSKPGKVTITLKKVK